MQPVLTLFTKPNNQTVLSVVFVDLAEIVALRAILYAAVSTETVNLAVGCFVNVFWVYHGKRTTHCPVLPN
jgi:hypothetical protein